MLDNTGAIHAINIRQRNRLGLLLDPRLQEADVVVEVLAQDGEAGVGDDAGQFGGVGVAALLVEGVVLGEVDGDVGVEGLGRVLLPVQRLDEGVEDGALLPLGRGTRWAVGVGGADLGVGALGERVRGVVGHGEDEGEGGEGGEEDGKTHSCKKRGLVRDGNGRWC